MILTTSLLTGLMIPVSATNFANRDSIDFGVCENEDDVQTILTKAEWKELNKFNEQEIEKARQNGGTYTYLIPGTETLFSTENSLRYGNISITRLMQTDDDGEDVNVNGTSPTKTIGQVGCSLTSFAMMLNYYTGGSSHTPETVNTTLGTVAAVFSNSWKDYYTTVNQCDYYSISSYSTNSMRLIMVQQLQQYQRPSIFCVKQTTTNKLHYVISCGYNIDSYGNYDIILVDPINRTVNGSTYIPTLLSEYSYYDMFGGYVWLLNSVRVFY